MRLALLTALTGLSIEESDWQQLCDVLAMIPEFVSLPKIKIGNQAAVQTK